MKFYLQFFRYEHLPKPLQETARRFHDLAFALFSDLYENQESEMMMRKLLEAKDCAVRAMLYEE